MRSARWIFAIAGIYGLVALIPQYFLEANYGANNPPAITHPEFYYGFIGVALAFQIAFLIIASDPVRFRPIMLAGVVEKFSFGIAIAVLYMNGRYSGDLLLAAAIDLFLGALFIAAYIRTTGTLSAPDSGH